MTIKSFIQKLIRKIKKLFLPPPLPPIYIKDEYINWLSMANAGMLNPGNIYCFDYVARNLKGNYPVIEIGSFCGLSVNVFSYFLEKYKKNNRIFVCDKWIFEHAEKGSFVGNSKIMHDDLKFFVKESFKRNINFFSKNNLPFAIEEISDDFFKLWSNNREVEDVFGEKVKLGGKISFCYIDGNHSYEFTKRDFENTDKFLERGGFVLFDDSADGYTFECAKFVQEVKRNKDYKLIMKNPNYLFQKI